MARRPHILLLRDARPSDPYVAAFEAIGFSARCVPVLHFEFVGRDALARAVARADNYAGLLLTSPRAVGALENVELDGWRGKPAFVVGPATGEGVRALGLEPEGEEAGQADDLADVIAARRFDRPLLFLCGDRRRNTLPDRLRAEGGVLEEIVVYRTLVDTTALREAAIEPPDWVAFFSPSGVEAASEVEAMPWNRIRKAAIGPTTADALRAAGFAPSAVAAEPVPAALAAAVSLAHSSTDV